MTYYHTPLFLVRSFTLTRAGFRGGAGACVLLFWQSHVFLWSFWRTTKLNHSAKLIINNASLTYVYPNTIKTYLTHNHLLFSRQLLCYSNTASTVVRNLTVLSSITDKINYISNHFWHRWKHECVVNLYETQQASKLNVNPKKLCCASLWWKGAQTLLENCYSIRGIAW